MIRAAVFFLIFCIILKVSSGEKYIINADPGADDAMAIIALLRYEATKPAKEFKIIGITCSYGNTDERNSELNILNTLTVAGREDIPVYAGAKKGFIEKFTTDNTFGVDGFGNMNFTHDTTKARIDRSKHAAVALVDMVNDNAGRVSIINLGPTTNIAMAISLDDNFLKKVNKVYQMGGSIKGIGNKRPNVEFNFAADPESNFLLFNSSKKSQITMYPWENSVDAILTKDWRMNVLGKYDSPYIDFSNKIEGVLLSHPRTKWLSADLLLVMSIIEPEIIINQKFLNVYPVIQGEARGSVLVDYSRNSGRIPNANVVLENNKTMFQELMVRYLTCKEIPCYFTLE